MTGGDCPGRVIAPAVIGAAIALSCGGRVLFSPSGEDGGLGSAGASGDSSAGSGASAGSNGGSPNVAGAGGASAPGLGGGAGRDAALDRLIEDGRTLDSLAEDELRLVCLEDARLSDSCVERGMDQPSREACEEFIAGCRPTVDAVSCNELRRFDCPALVADLFSCLEAWYPLLGCDRKGDLIETPEPCRPLRECDEFRNEFFQFGLPPSCDPATAPDRPPADDGIFGLDGCAPLPERLIALGGSVITCTGDEPDGYGCAPDMLAHYIRTKYSPNLQYENLASSGGLGGFSNLRRQAELAGPSTGHVAVFIFSLPDDIDPAALEIDRWRTEFEDSMSYFADPGVASGATFLLNTQYSPSDQCPHPLVPVIGPPPLNQEEEDALLAINQDLFIQVGVTRADTVTVDQHSDWLGHGWQRGAPGCPHCYSDNTPWLSDGIHPNRLGQVHIFEKWRIAVDRIYGEGCAG